MDRGVAVGISITVIMLSALFFDRFKLPLILGVLLAGILTGPYSPLAGIDFLGVNFGNIIITDPSLISVFAVIGSALILFGIGLEFSVNKLSQLGLFTFLAAIVKIGIVYLVAYGTLYALGFSTQASALVAIAMSFSSTPIIIKLLEASGKIRRPEVPFIISILIIEDLLAVFFLGLITHPAASASEYSFAISLLRVVLTFIFAYVVLSRVISWFLTLISHSDELLILGTVSLVLVIGYLAEAVGLSFSVGAFLAGSTIAGSSASRKIEEKIRPFNSLFASFFFFSIGLLVNIGAVFSNLPLLFVFIGIGIAVRFAASGTASYFAGFSGRNACFCAAAFLSVSELSLLLMSQGMASGVVSSEFLGTFAFAIIVTSFLAAWLINRENEMYNFLQSVVPQFIVNNMRLLRSTALGMRRAVSESSRYYNVVEKLPSISSHTDQLSVREQLVLTSKNATILMLISTAAYVGIFLQVLPEWRAFDSLFVFIFTIFFVASALFLVNARSAASCLMKMMTHSSTGVKYAAIGHFFVAAVFFVLCVIYFWGYSLAPSSLSIILVLPAAAFSMRSLISMFRAISLGGVHL
ncbi:Glutathione-regulated potassium-efflux system protein KefB [uncultured archaeon]|nr:Glutathione-regulated potassium-efflux system protein KefB [uncultured archaeon]